MKKKFIKVSVLFSIGMIALAACSPPASPTQAPALIPVTGSTLPSPVEIQPEIPHQTVPVELPSGRMGKIGDYDSSTTGKVAPGGDRFSRGEFERPFNAYTMDAYFPYLDIQNALIYQDDTWIYGIIVIKNSDTDKTLPGNYALELDTNVDGKGDWLIMTSKPSSTDWTVNGVQVWQDADGDVGAGIPVRADEHTAPGNGFETNVFDGGQGNDPDTAWVRIAPDDAAAIQVAVKYSLINDDAYLAGVWAGNAALDPALFDFNDHMTHEQAGAADAGLENFYPIKGLAELDNSCRMAIGFEPKGNEPGLCKEVIIKPEKPGEPPPPEPVKPPNAAPPNGPG